MDWRKKLIELRTSKRLSQADLAQVISAHQSRVAKWENGDGIPTIEQGIRLCRALGVTLDYFADSTQDQPPLPIVLPGEEAILELVRGLGLDLREALRRLATPPIPTGPVLPGPAVRVPFDEDPSTPGRWKK